MEAVQLLAICSQVLHNAELFQKAASQQTIRSYCLNRPSNTSSLLQSDEIGLWEMQTLKESKVSPYQLQALHITVAMGRSVRVPGASQQSRMKMFSGICQGLEIHPE